jgi:3,4-dihydroxy 2-butanone 4-phosphate synthase/GTP cyclohydrolase II
VFLEEQVILSARLAGFKSAGVVEIMNEDGTMARLPQLAKVAKKFDLKLVSIEAQPTECSTTV